MNRHHLKHATLSSRKKELSKGPSFPPYTESLATGNASRLAAMQRADKNIDELPKELNGAFHRLRQSGIDEVLFDVFSCFEALSVEEK